MSLWKADYLEAKYKGMTPRFPHTKKLLRLKNVPKKLSGLKDTDVDDMILSYKRDEFEKKWHLGNRKLTKSLAVYKDDDMIVDRTLLRVSKLTKLLLNALQGSQRKDPPAWVSDEVRDIILNQTECHPSTFFKSHADDKDKLAFVLKVWNAKTMKKTLAEIEWLFRMIRGNITTIERRKHARDMGTSESDIHSESEESEENDDNHHYNEFDGMVALGLDDDDEDSTEDSFFKGGSDTDQEDQKYNLPELIGGYASLSEDEEPENTKTEKKNRRGQRARQRIWKKKFGSEAKHVKLQREQEASERRQRQLEYEERCRKREQKAREEEERKKDNPNYIPLKEKKVAVHPSWEAKRKAQEQLSKVEFAGKKIKFD